MNRSRFIPRLGSTAIVFLVGFITASLLVGVGLWAGVLHLPPRDTAEKTAHVISPTPHALRLRVIGDSLSLPTAGFTQDTSWIHLLAQHGRIPPVQAENLYFKAGLTISDCLTLDWVDRCVAELASDRLDVVVAVGHDDFAELVEIRNTTRMTPQPQTIRAWIERFDRNYQNLLDRLLAAKRGIVLPCTLCNWQQVPGFSRFGLTDGEVLLAGQITGKINAVITAAAKNRGLPVAEVGEEFTRLMHNDPRLGELGIKAQECGTAPTAFYGPDAMHPGPVGSAFFANQVVLALNLSTGNNLQPFSLTDIRRINGSTP